MFRYSFLLAVLAYSLSGCVTTNTFIQVKKDPDISVSEKVKTIAIVDRTLIDKKDKVKNVMEGLFSGELLHQDRQGEQEVLAGLNSILSSSGRFGVKMTNIQLTGSWTGNIFPVPLDTAEVGKICNSYNADAIVALEIYDTDQQNGRWEIVKLGFRLYDRSNQSIGDQYFYTYRFKYPHPYSRKANYYERNSTNQASYEAGVNYGRRISPSLIRVKRIYFASGNAQLLIGGRKAQMGDWNGASEIWKQVVQSTDLKNAGRAAYNLALAAEANGDLEQAQMWVNKAFADFGNQKAKKYGMIINERIFQKQKIQ